ncbi:MAG: ATP-dependent helicase [Ignavibacteriales bacterium]|nr:ATP-dependent helicase [Ignavibacteriales bacterium]
MKKFTLTSHTGSTLTLVHPTRFTIDYRKELNDAQYKAVTSLDGPYLVIAGAGTGKTRAIVFRVAYLVELGVKPDRILLLTFTRKASREMLRRASMLLDSRCDNVSGGTFHSFANGVLRKYASLLGYDNNFTILDQGDAQDVINLIRTRMKLDTRQKRFPRKETIYDLHSRALNTMTPVDELLAADYPHYVELLEDIRKIHAAYMVYKKQNNLMDYDDLLVNLAELLRQQESVRASLSARYTYIMVDEYQDTNKIQAEIVRLLAYKHQNVMVVGDDAQSIYSFRGSSIKNILSFPEEFPGCVSITLEENFRSSMPILRLANEILRGSMIR